MPMASVIQSAADSGADGYLLKSFSPVDLDRLILSTLHYPTRAYRHYGLLGAFHKKSTCKASRRQLFSCRFLYPFQNQFRMKVDKTYFQIERRF